MKNSFCILPFTAVDVREDMTFGPCCLTRNVGRFSSGYGSIDHYFVSDDLAAFRNEMLSGIRPPECISCWKNEDAGLPSMRTDANIDTKHSHVVDPMVRKVHLFVGNHCNLACTMCSPNSSSMFRQLWKSDFGIGNSKTLSTSYDTVTHDWIIKNAHVLECINVSGGEPLISTGFLSLLDELIKHDQTGMRIEIVTNGTTLSPKITDLLYHFDDVLFVVSVDGVGKVNDYQRWPSRFDKISTNLALMKDIGFDVVITPTYTALTLLHIPELEHYCKLNGYHLMERIRLVEDWPQLLPIHLPDSIKKKIDPRFASLIDHDGDPTMLIEHIKKWDSQRRISITDYLPEWQDCL